MNTVMQEWNMHCPQCGEDDKLDIAGTVWMRLTPDGTDIDAPPDHDHDWDEDSAACCRNCEWTGTVKDATFEPDEDDEEKQDE